MEPENWTQDSKGNYVGITHLSWLASEMKAPVPSQPSDMSWTEYNILTEYEFHNDSVGRNTHAGANANYSIGCLLLGNQYALTTFYTDSDRFKEGGVLGRENYLVPAFTPQDTVNATFEYYKIFQCAKQHNAGFKFLIKNKAPERRGPAPIPMPPSPDSHPPKGIPVNDGGALK